MRPAGTVLSIALKIVPRGRYSARCSSGRSARATAVPPAATPLNATAAANLVPTSSRPSRPTMICVGIHSSTNHANMPAGEASHIV